MAQCEPQTMWSDRFKSKTLNMVSAATAVWRGAGAIGIVLSGGAMFILEFLAGKIN